MPRRPWGRTICAPSTLEEIQAAIFHVDCNLARNGLTRIRVKRNHWPVRKDQPDIPDWRQCSKFVIRRHDCDKDRLW